MPSLFSGINVALRAVLSHQEAIAVVQHNVANANTPGYRRQGAVLGAAPAFGSPSLQFSVASGQIGMGVTVERIRRFSLDFLDAGFRRESAQASRWETMQGTLRQLEATLAESSTDGLLPKLDAFWASWQSAAADPANTALRQAVLSTTEQLAQAFNRRAQALITLQSDQDQAVEDRGNEINALASKVASLNVEVARVQASGLQPNDLLDERDRVLDRLAQVAGAISYTQADGKALVSIAGHALVVGETAFTLQAAPDPANSGLMGLTWSDGRPFRAAGGELAGLLEVRDTVIPNQLAGLNTLATNLAARTNALHQAGFGLPPANTTGQPLFQAFTTANTALELKLNPLLSNPADLALASAANQPGDGSTGRLLSGLQFEQLMNGGTATLNQAYLAQTGTLGHLVQRADDGQRDSQLLVDSLATQREATSGVSLDEEAAQLVQSQRAYEAAARLMSAVDDMLDRVINGMGRVGL
jgi:flagellar hook-associated protein 1 FlgK